MENGRAGRRQGRKEGGMVMLATVVGAEVGWMMGTTGTDGEG